MSPDDRTIPFDSGDSDPSREPDRPTLPLDGAERSTDAFAQAESSDAIGNYRLVDRIGVGGMGEVWVAEQERPVRRRVALKLIRAGMNTGQFVARFEAERQALAMMDHPNIATVLDAGTTERGLPYFVMEYVPGKPITQHCEEHDLDARERLALFAQVCDGVQHAHEKAIIHRDLKPSNILVTVVDGRPVPKIIDFGVAKALTQQLTEVRMETQAGALIGTLEYMSPEQLNLSGDIDTRTDVYSLGVVLYETLVGALPFETTDIAVTGLDEFRRRVREDDPILPSTRITTSIRKRTPGDISRSGLDLSALRRTLRGDLDWIVMKALEKERSRRYASPRELAADIQRYLDDEPVLAVPPSRRYRMRKFARRHRMGVALTALGVVAIFATVTGLAYGLHRANLAEAEARAEAARTQAVNRFLQEMLASANPEQTLGREITVREMLDEASRTDNEALQGQWDIQAEVRTTIGNTYEALGLYEQAEPQLSTALELRRGHLGEDHVDVAESLHNLGRVRWQAGDAAQAESLIVEALATYRKHLEPGDERIATCLNDLGVVMQSRGDLARAEEMFREALAIRRELFGNRSREVAEALSNVAWTLYFEGDVAGAEPMFREALEANEALLGPQNPLVLAFRLNLAAVCQRLGKSDEAERLYGESLEGMRTVLGPEHSTTLRGQTSFVEFLLERGRPDTAEPLLADALATAERTLGPDHELTIRLVADTGWLYRVRGDAARSEASYRETLARRARTLGEDHPDTIRVQWQVARALVDQGRFAEATPLAREALDRSRRTEPAVPENTCSSLLYLGLSLLGRGQAAGAEPLLRECVETRSAQPAASAAWETAYARHALGRAIAAQGRFAEAEPILREALAQLEERPTPAARLTEARQATGAFYGAWEKVDPTAAAKARASRDTAG